MVRSQISHCAVVTAGLADIADCPSAGSMSCTPGISFVSHTKVDDVLTSRVPLDPHGVEAARSEPDDGQAIRGGRSGGHQPVGPSYPAPVLHWVHGCLPVKDGKGGAPHRGHGHTGCTELVAQPCPGQARCRASTSAPRGCSSRTRGPCTRGARASSARAPANACAHASSAWAPSHACAHASWARQGGACCAPES
jgi:hypothetical protein